MITLHCFQKYLAIALSVSFSLLMLKTKTVRAEYVPPPEQEAPSDYTKSVAAGHRGSCCNDANPPLTLLAPQTYVGRTTLTHPTFAWFVSQPQIVQLEFRLFEYDNEGKPSHLIASSIPSRQSSKIQTITLKKESAGLKVGRKYLWQITAYCPDSSIVSQIRADLRVLAVNPTSSHSDRSLWYDVLKQALAARKAGVETEIADLLEQLADIEATSLQERGLLLSDRLQQILDTEFGVKASYRSR